MQAMQAATAANNRNPVPGSADAGGSAIIPEGTDEIAKNMIGIDIANIKEYLLSKIIP